MWANMDSQVDMCITGRRLLEGYLQEPLNSYQMKTQFERRHWGKLSTVPAYVVAFVRLRLCDFREPAETLG